MYILIAVIREAFFLFAQMAPYLLFGFFFAGVLHIFLKPETVARHLGKNNFAAVLKASLFGIPLPLCSCGVIPAALSLRKEGAHKGATLSFLISTPTTGIDSILATFALLGGFFTFYRVLASFVAAILVGLAANLLMPDRTEVKKKEDDACSCCGEKANHAEHTLLEKIRGVFSYAFGTLLEDSAGWLCMGILIGGVISYFVPDEFVHTYLGSGWVSILVMLAVGTPMYICSTGSIPIAAALMMKGLNPGAAFAFLVAGPATNTVTMAAVFKHLGKGALVLYLFSIAVCSFLFGLLLNYLWHTGVRLTDMHVHDSMGLFTPLEILSSSVLCVLIVVAMWRRWLRKRG